VILLILAIEMVIGQGQASSRLTEGQDPMRLARVPLAVPYLLNPVGIVALMTISAEAQSLRVLAAEIAVLVLVLLLDLVVCSAGPAGSGRLSTRTACW
jgi:multiple antibiotic resistance protein